MRSLSLSILSLLLCAMTARAATNTAATASLSDVTAAVSASVDGDTVIVPAGTAGWSSSLTVNKSISIIGEGKDQTVITCPTGANSYAIDLESGSFNRVSGIQFKSSLAGSGVKVGANTYARIDNCAFVGCYQQGIGAWGYRAYGVADHCWFTNCQTFVYKVGNDSASWSENAGGPLLNGTGTTNGFYEEDNFYVYDDTTPNPGGSEQGWYCTQGARSEIRHCTIKAAASTYTCWLWDEHGNNNFSGSRGTIYYICISNTIDMGTTGQRTWYHRGGMGVWLGNTLINTHTTWPIAITDEECWPSYAGNFGGQYWTTFPRWDQITNTWVVGNTMNGAALTNGNVAIYDGGDPTADAGLANCIQQGRDYFVSNSLPSASLGLNVSFPSGTITNGQYGFTDLVYPHPLVTAGDSGTNRPVISDPELTGTTFTLSVPTQLNVNYVLEFKNFLTDAVWTSLRTNSGNGGMMNLTNTGTVDPSRFYRIRIQ